MKAASETDAERAKTHEVVQRIECKAREHIVSSLPKTEDKFVLAIRSQILSGSRLFTGIACDDCGTELTNDGALLLCLPPKRWHDCPACGKRHLVRE